MATEVASGTENTTQASPRESIGTRETSPTQAPVLVNQMSPTTTTVAPAPVNVRQAVNSLTCTARFDAWLKKNTRGLLWYCGCFTVNIIIMIILISSLSPNTPPDLNVGKLVGALNDAQFPNATSQPISQFDAAPATTTLLPVDFTSLATLGILIDQSSLVIQAGRLQYLYFRVPSTATTVASQPTPIEQLAAQVPNKPDIPLPLSDYDLHPELKHTRHADYQNFKRFHNVLAYASSSGDNYVNPLGSSTTINGFGINFGDSSSVNIVPMVQGSGLNKGLSLMTSLSDGSKLYRMEFTAPRSMCEGVDATCENIAWNGFASTTDNSLASGLSQNIPVSCQSLCDTTSCGSVDTTGLCSVCANQNVAGADTPVTRDYVMPQESGAFQFVYQTYTVQDRITVWNDGALVFDSGCVGTEVELTTTISFQTPDIRVDVEPNCACANPDNYCTGTLWYFTVGCPCAANDPTCQVNQCTINNGGCDPGVACRLKSDQTPECADQAMIVYTKRPVGGTLISLIPEARHMSIQYWNNLWADTVLPDDEDEQAFQTRVPTAKKQGGVELLVDGTTYHVCTPGFLGTIFEDHGFTIAQIFDYDDGYGGPISRTIVKAINQGLDHDIQPIFEQFIANANSYPYAVHMFNAGHAAGITQPFSSLPPWTNIEYFAFSRNSNAFASWLMWVVNGDTSDKGFVGKLSDVKPSPPAACPNQTPQKTPLSNMDCSTRCGVTPNTLEIAKFIMAVKKFVGQSKVGSPVPVETLSWFPFAFDESAFVLALRNDIIQEMADVGYTVGPNELLITITSAQDATQAVPTWEIFTDASFLTIAPTNISSPIFVGLLTALTTPRDEYFNEIGLNCSMIDFFPLNTPPVDNSTNSGGGFNGTEMESSSSGGSNNTSPIPPTPPTPPTPHSPNDPAGSSGYMYGQLNLLHRLCALAPNATLLDDFLASEGVGLLGTSPIILGNTSGAIVNQPTELLVMLLCLLAVFTASVFN